MFLPIQSDQLEAATVATYGACHFAGTQSTLKFKIGSTKKVTPFLPNVSRVALILRALLVILWTFGGVFAFEAWGPFCGW